MQARNISPILAEALADTPVVLLKGARQAGKSTLSRNLAPDRDYVTLDDPLVLAAAFEDPIGFIRNLPRRVVIDEIQRVPELFLPIKYEIDRERLPGRFLLTGSADVMLSPRLADTLAGRIEAQTLWPFSQGEIRGIREVFVDAMFAGYSLRNFEPQTLDIVQAIAAGGFPEARTRTSDDRRVAWFGSYVGSVIDRELKQLSQIEGVVAIPRILQGLAARVSGLLNLSDLSRTIGVPHSTLQRYLALLSGTFLVWLLPAWHADIGKRLVKSPKAYLVDTGLLCYLLGIDRSRLAGDRQMLGPILENFVGSELKKQIGYSRLKPDLAHFRTQKGAEVDYVLALRDGRIAGVEVKASRSVAAEDFKGLRALAEVAGSRFGRGVLLHLGERAVSFGPGFDALPVDALWRLEAN